MIRTTLDIQVEKGNEEEILKALTGEANLKALSMYLTSVLIPSFADGVKLVGVGGSAHVHGYRDAGCTKLYNSDSDEPVKPYRTPV